MKSRRTITAWLVGALLIGGLPFDFDAVVHAVSCTGARPCHACRTANIAGTVRSVVASAACVHASNEGIDGGNWRLPHHLQRRGETGPCRR